LTRYSLTEQTIQLLLTLSNEENSLEELSTTTPSHTVSGKTLIVSAPETEDCGECLISSAEADPSNHLHLTVSSIRTPLVRTPVALSPSALSIKPTTASHSDSDSDSDESESGLNSNQFLSNTTPTVTHTPRKDLNITSLKKPFSSPSLPTSLAPPPQHITRPTSSLVTPIPSGPVITSSSIKRKQNELVPEAVVGRTSTSNKSLPKKKKKSTNDIDDIFGGLG
jgi:hypothetical protein